MLITCLSLFSNNGLANVINVPDDFETIQAAVNSTQEGDTVLVEPGEYNERVGMPAHNIVLTSLRLIEGDENFIEQTIIDGVNINRSTVRISAGTDERTVIDGFTIINGNTDYGGGIYVANARPTLRFLVLADNNADRGGGGLYVTRTSSVNISNSTIRNNFGFIGGGVVVINESRLTVTDCLIEGNTTNEHGAGIHCTLDSELNLEDVIIRENEATMFGAGLHLNARSQCEMNRVSVVDNRGDTGGGIAVRAEAMLNATNVDVVGNFSNTNGGGLYADGSFVTMVNCNFLSNISEAEGGAQYFWDGTAEFIRCLIADNECPEAGIIHNLWGNIFYRNCTIANNRGEESSEIGVVEGNITLWNSIVWSENRPILTTSEEEADTIAVSHCDIIGGQDAIEHDEGDFLFWGDGSIDEDPLFVEVEELDYHLTGDSPCIDAGDPRVERDPDNTRADIGVFYFHQDEDPLPRRHEVPHEFETIQEAINASEDGDTVFVHRGEYEENIDFEGKNILVIGNPEDPTEVIINGNGNGTTVTISNNEQDESVLEGFTITGGSGTRLELNGNRPSGGGILIIDASPVISNCIIEGNELAEADSRRGGGIAIWRNSEPVIRDCIIRDNEAGDGGGISVSFGCLVTLDNVEIINNSAFDGDDSDGAGIYVRGTGNENDPHINMTDCRISGNDGVFGSGLFLFRCSARLDGCEISGNNGFYGAGILAIICEVELTNATVAGNEVDDRRNDWGVIDISGGVATITNSILYQPDELDLTSNYFDNGDQIVNIAYSLIDGGEDGLQGDGFTEINWGEGNIDENPLFVDIENDDFHLTEDSPCIDTGDPEADEDPDGTRADMGAYYFDHDEDEFPNRRDVPEEYETIQAAIDAAEDEDIVLVAPGEYVENIDFLGKAITVTSHIHLEDDQNFIEQTIIDGNEEGSVVTFRNEEGQESILRGFTVRNGLNENGGGIVCLENTQPILRDLLITNNSAREFGGGIYLGNDSEPLIDRVLISGNSARNGGGIANQGAHSSTIRNSEICYNEASQLGGGIFGEMNCGFAVSWTAIYNNTAEDAGGVCMRGTVMRIRFTNVTIARNENTGILLGIDEDRGRGCHLILTNCIVYDNGGLEISLSDNDDNGIGTDLDVYYSDVQDGQRDIRVDEHSEIEWGEGNIDEDPLFADPDNDDLHLTEDSPCIDAGDWDSEDDPDGTRADIGAYYFHQDREPDDNPRRREVPTEYDCIADALRDSENGDTVLVHPGTYEEHDLRVGRQDLTFASLYLLTGNPEHISTTIIDAENADFVVNLGGFNSHICGFTLVNGANFNGGGLIISSHNARVSKMIIRDCSAEEYGGGIYTQITPGITIEDTEVFNCTAERAGGGYFGAQRAEVTISNSHFHDNEAGTGGGLAHIWAGGSLTVESTLIENNEANLGGGLYATCGSPITIIDSEVRENNASRGGGGIYVSGESTLECRHTVVYNNSSERTGGGIFLSGSEEKVLFNITVVSNRSNAGGGIYFETRNTTLENSILWENAPQSFAANENADFLVTYCDIEGGRRVNIGGTFGDGNIDEDPLFVDAENFDYHLTEDSPCIDAGDPDSPEDPDDTRADMGAFPYDQRNPAEEEHFVDYIETDLSHTITIEDFMFDGEAAPDGWEIAVFTREYLLSGAVLWMADEEVALIAYGDNPDTDATEGFYDGEWMMNFKAWDPEDEREHRLGYNIEGEIGLRHWHNEGETVLSLWGNSDIVERIIELDQGWNNVDIDFLPSREFFTDPDDEFPEAVPMLYQFWDRSVNDAAFCWVLLLENERGRFYHPRSGFNNLIRIIPGEAYAIRMERPMTATWWGTPLGGEEPELQHFVDFTDTDFSFELTIPEFSFEDEEVAAGWEIGVFTRDDVLAGAGVWTGEGELVVTVYGDDPETDEIEGLYQGEWMGNLRVWNPETDEVHRAGWDGFFGPHWNNGRDVQLNIRVAADMVEQTVQFRDGWNMVSLNIRPSLEFCDPNGNDFPDIVLMTWQLWDMIDDGGRNLDEHHHHILVKDALGQFYAPAWGFHNIPGWLPDQGYQILMDTDMMATWWGTQIAPDEEILLVEGWGIYPYYPSYELDASAPDFYVLSNVIENIELAKDELGNFLTPEFQFSNMPPWRHGRGYQIKTTQECVLVYPEERDGELNAMESTKIHHWTQPVSTGNNMSLLVELREPISQNLEIAAFSESGQLVGCGSVDENGLCGLAIWGDAEVTKEVDGLLEGEELILKLWDGGIQDEIDLYVSELVKGTGLIYCNDGFIVLACTKVPPLPTEMKILSISPNPFNPTTTIHYSLPQASTVALKMYDLSGRMVSNLFNGRQEAGIQSATVNANTWASGLYFVRLEAGGEVFTRKVMLVR